MITYFGHKGVVALSWWRKIIKRGYGVTTVEPIGNHTENLMVHPIVDIPAIREFHGLPVWVEISPEMPTAITYDGLLWEADPMGEYLYFLAGDFPKNEKGLLRYGSAGTVAEVYVSFESDVIAVDRQDTQRFSEEANVQKTYSTDFIGSRVGEISSFAKERTHESGFERRLVTLDLPSLSDGVGYMEQYNNYVSGPWVRLVWSKHTMTSQGPRVTCIFVRSNNPEQEFALMHNLMETLVDDYQDIKGHPLSGAIRV